MDPNPAPDFIVPNMKVGCLPYQALADSTLECFFSAACLNETARWISNLPVKSRPPSLNSSAMDSFLPTTPISAIFANSMIDHWQESSNFSGYFHNCQPVQCTFTTLRKNGFMNVATLLVGVFGGLTVALHIITPFLIKAARFIFYYIKRRLLPMRQGQSSMSFEAMVSNLIDTMTNVILLDSSTTNSFAGRTNGSRALPITSTGMHAHVLIFKYQTPSCL